MDGKEHGIAAKNINPYLVDARDVILARRARPLAAMAVVLDSSKIAGGGYLCTCLGARRLGRVEERFSLFDANRLQ
ncbi:MAG: hypothetical protein M3120_10940 [Pseudomonadota bacterium]|nr:hypothetical protein [Pseudomonadota bacterium]